MTGKPRVAYLTAGGAGMFCGSCMRDNTLAAALAKLDCDPWLIPLYTPIRTDEADVSVDRVFFGGINVYLQQRIPLLRYLPGFLDRWLDAPWLLNRVSAGSIEVQAQELGDLTLSMLRGEHGRQRKEVRRLVAWLKRDVKPALVNFSNILIAGCVPAIKRELHVPVLATLQGDDLFLEDLPASHKGDVMQEVRRLAGLIDGFVVFSDYYAGFMADYLHVPRDRFHLAPMGLATDDLPADDHEPPAGRPPTVGYFARICPAKGFHRLVDAWLTLRTMPNAERVRLHAAGWLGAGDRPFFERERQRIADAGAVEDFHYDGVVDRAGKWAFLRGIDVFSVPTVYREPKGIYILEALAHGVPVVQPEHGAFPELLAGTGGGTLVPPDDTAALAAALHHLLFDHATRRDLGRHGRHNVRQQFTAAHMAEKTLEIYRRFL